MICVHCGRPVFVNAADGVAYHESTADRKCHYWEGTTLAVAKLDDVRDRIADLGGERFKR